MLYSRSHDIGLAHYPKTAGHSLTEWFRSVFPDAAFVLPPDDNSVSHHPVRDSLESLGLITPPAAAFLLRQPIGRFLERAAHRLGAGSPIGRSRTRVIGVVREPFEMLVSLFEHWRDFSFKTEPHDPFMVTARRGEFRDFLSAAVVRGALWNYHEFFDINGPAWQSTRLVDFHNLRNGLRVVCRDSVFRHRMRCHGETPVRTATATSPATRRWRGRSCMTCAVTSVGITGAAPESSSGATHLRREALCFGGVLAERSAACYHSPSRGPRGTCRADSPPPLSWQALSGVSQRPRFHR